MLLLQRSKTLIRVCVCACVCVEFMPVCVLCFLPFLKLAHLRLRYANVTLIHSHSLRGVASSSTAAAAAAATIAVVVSSSSSGSSVRIFPFWQVIAKVTQFWPGYLPEAECIVSLMPALHARTWTTSWMQPTKPTKPTIFMAHG